MDHSDERRSGVISVTAPGFRTSYLLIVDEADPRFVEQQETTMKRDLLNDEHLDLVAGGKPAGHGSGTGGGTGGGHGNGTGGGDGLGWLRNLIRGIFG
jgi:hypothetical protein